MQSDTGAAVLADNLAGLSDQGVLDVAVAAIRQLQSTTLAAALDDDALRDSVTALQRCESMVHAEKLRRIAEVEERKAFRAAAQRSTADWVADACGLTAGEARQQARNAEVLCRLPETSKKLADGDITPGHAGAAAQGFMELERQATIRRQDAGGDVDAFNAAVDEARTIAEEFDRMVADAAPTQDRIELAKTINGWTSQREPDALKDRERRAMTKRGIQLAGQRDDNGLWQHRLALTDAANAQFLASLNPLSRKTGKDDDRTPAQRCHDALVAMAQLAADSGDIPATAGGSRAQVLLIREEREPSADGDGEQSRAGQGVHVDGLGPVSSATAALFECDADTTIINRDPATRRIWDVGHTNGNPSRAQRAAVIARDRACVGCGAPAARCHIHHIRWRRHGGTTFIDNLVLVCWSCHQGIHHLDWTITGDPLNGFGISRHPAPAGAATHGAGPPDL